MVAAPAFAGLQKEFSVFNDCPLSTPGVVGCVVSYTTSGEFHLGSKTVPINPLKQPGATVAHDPKVPMLQPHVVVVPTGPFAPVVLKSTPSCESQRSATTSAPVRCPVSRGDLGEAYDIGVVFRATKGSPQW